jgi:hypothetical protein
MEIAGGGSRGSKRGHARHRAIPAGLGQIALLGLVLDQTQIDQDLEQAPLRRTIVPAPGDNRNGSPVAKGHRRIEVALHSAGIDRPERFGQEVVVDLVDASQATTAHGTYPLMVIVRVSASNDWTMTRI